jgi:hypothetical protein
MLTQVSSGRRYRSLDFVDLFEIYADGVEHRFYFVDVTYTMTCQVYCAILMIWRFELSVH